MEPSWSLPLSLSSLVSVAMPMSFARFANDLFCRSARGRGRREGGERESFRDGAEVLLEEAAAAASDMGAI